MRITLADSSYIDCSTVFPLYLKLSGKLQQSPSGVSETVHIGCSVFCCVLPNLTSNMVLGIDWLYTVNPLITWSTHSLSMGCIGKIIYILGTN